jgi:hypothetical protein
MVIACVNDPTGSLDLKSRLTLQRSQHPSVALLWRERERERDELNVELTKLVVGVHQSSSHLHGERILNVT